MKKVLFVSLLSLLLSFNSFGKGISVSSDAKLFAESILPLKISSGESKVILLKPVAESDTGMSESLPNYCILNATADIKSEGLTVNIGNVVCISEDKRILEGVFDGQAKLLSSKCSTGCRSLDIEQGERFELTLNSGLELTLQKRADEVEE